MVVFSFTAWSLTVIDGEPRRLTLIGAYSTMLDGWRMIARPPAACGGGIAIDSPGARCRDLLPVIPGARIDRFVATVAI
jgi:hypothetical protein